MRIQARQVEELQSRAIRRLARRWLPRLREHFALELGRFGDDAAIEHTAAGITRGREYGLSTDAELYRFVIARLALRDGFDEDPLLPWVRRILREGEGTPEMREIIARAIEHLSGAATQEASGA